MLYAEQWRHSNCGGSEMKTPEEMNEILEAEIARAKEMNPDYDARAAVHAALEHTYMQGRSPMQIPSDELSEISKKIGDHMVYLFDRRRF